MLGPFGLGVSIGFFMKKRHEQKLVILSFFLLIGFNLPMLLIFDQNESFLGLPISYFYVLSLWLFSVVVAYVVIRRYYE